MPTAPMAQRQVGDQAFPNVRVSAAPTDDTYGGQIGDTVARASVRMYDLQTRSSDHAAVQEAETRANEQAMEIEQEVRKFKGKNAGQAPDYAREKWDEFHGAQLASLSNDRQKAMYHAVGLQKGEHLNRGALSYFNQENERFQAETHNAFIESSVNKARDHANDDEQIGAEKGHQAFAVEQKAVRLGYKGEDQEKAELAEVHSRTNTEVIMARLNAGNDLKAEEYYKKIKKFERPQDKVNEETGEVLHIPSSVQFTAKDRDTVERGLQEGSTRGASRRTAQELIGKYGVETVEQRKALLGAVDGIKDDKVADLVKQRVEHEFSAFDQLKKDQAEQTFMGASKTIEERWKTNPKAHIRDMVPVSEWNRMTPGEQHTLETKLERLKSPEQRHDPNVWLKGQLLSPEKLALLTTQEMTKDYLNHFDQRHHDQFIEDVKQARNAQTKDGKKDETLSPLSLREQIKNGWIDSKIAKDPNKLQGDETIWFNRYETEAARALSSLPKNAKQKDIDEALNAVKDPLLKEKFTVPGSFFGFFSKQVPGVALRDSIKMKDIPIDRQTKLKDALLKSGLPVTESNIEELEAKSRMKKQGVK